MNFKKEQFSKILKEISNSYGSINKMAKETGVTASYISKLIRLLYDSPPSPEILKKISDNSNFITNYDTLMNICGYLENTKFNSNNSKMKDNYSLNFSFTLYNKLNNTGQEKVNDYIKDLVNTKQYNKKNK